MYHKCILEKKKFGQKNYFLAHSDTYVNEFIFLLDFMSLYIDENSVANV